MTKLICVIHYPSYSPDLSLCECFLSPKLKTAMKEELYDDMSVIQAAVTKTFKNKDYISRVYVYVGASF